MRTSRFTHHERARDPGVMGQRQMNAAYAELGGTRGHAPPGPKRRAPEPVDDHLGVVPSETLLDQQRLGQGLLRGEPAGLGLDRQRGLGRREPASGEPRTASRRGSESRNLADVDADSDDHPTNNNGSDSGDRRVRTRVTDSGEH